jgi:hypothetical protein
MADCLFTKITVLASHWSTLRMKRGSREIGGTAKESLTFFPGASGTDTEYFKISGLLPSWPSRKAWQSWQSWQAPNLMPFAGWAEIRLCKAGPENAHTWIVKRTCQPQHGLPIPWTGCGYLELESTRFRDLLQPSQPPYQSTQCGRRGNIYAVYASAFIIRSSVKWHGE